MQTPEYVLHDPYLKPFEPQIVGRLQRAKEIESRLLQGSIKSLSDFANGHLFFGLHKTNTGWILREWAPFSKEIFIIGDFSGWQPKPEFAMRRSGDIWEIELPDSILKHGDLFKLLVKWEGGEGHRIPAWIKRVVQDPQTLIFTAQAWNPPTEYQWKIPNYKNPHKNPLIYEAHIGMASEEGKVGSYEEFRKHILPKIIKAGYNTIQLMAIQEHPYYGSFGYHVSNFFAVSSRFGTPEDLKALIDDIHAANLSVIMDLVHSHAVKNEIEGISKFDGSLYQYFHDGPKGSHVAWDSRCFNYGKAEVLHFLLSNCKFWLSEYKFDGFRFDGVTSMLYNDHGLGSNFTSYNQYYNGNQDDDALVYLKLANKLIHEIRPDAMSVAEEMSGMPGLCVPADKGGYGFDYRLSMGMPDYWIKIIKESKDEDWHVGQMFHELTGKRLDEKTISYAESHDQALVGDKTLIFRLIDSDMYWDMHKNRHNMRIDRGIALHKMIRLITLLTSGGGYLNFMGNEFGHPEWIDFPRQGNNWSYHYARRQWSLMDNMDLKYHYLSDFDRAMVMFFKENDILSYPSINKLMEHLSDQILIVERANFIFVFNFHPLQSFMHYKITIPVEGEYKIVLNTDSADFGGFGRLDESVSHFSLNQISTFYHYSELSLYIPNRTAYVLKKV